jgi:hypothetical protein
LHYIAELQNYNWQTAKKPFNKDGQDSRDKTRTPSN